MKQTFFIIGAQRSGTTWLAQALDAHPEIEMAHPLFPEPKFFLSREEVEKGEAYYFRKFYGRKQGAVLYGEKSTSYIESEKAAQGIAAMFPEARIIAVLRNPAERAVSNYFFSKFHGVETRNLREAFIEQRPLQTDLSRFSVSPVDYLGRGDYLKYIRLYESLFGKKQFKVLIFEKMITGKETLHSVFDFLQLAPVDFAGQDLEKNASLQSEEVSVEVWEYLKNYFRSSVRDLEDYLKTDLSIWDK